MSDKKITKQKDGKMIFSDGSEMSIQEYREKIGNAEKKDFLAKHPKKEIDKKELKYRKKIINEIIKYDRSAGLEYSKSGGFVRDNDGNMVFNEDVARETLEHFTTQELKVIASGMPTLKNNN